MRALYLASAITAVFLTAACEADSKVGPTPVPGTRTPGRLPGAIAVVSGQDQVGKAGEPLAVLFEVRVTDADGNPLSGVAVAFRIGSGAGVLGDTCNETNSRSVRSTQTDSSGIAST